MLPLQHMKLTVCSRLVISLHEKVNTSVTTLVAPYASQHRHLATLDLSYYSHCDTCSSLGDTALSSSGEGIVKVRQTVRWRSVGWRSVGAKGELRDGEMWVGVGALHAGRGGGRWLDAGLLRQTSSSSPQKCLQLVHARVLVLMHPPEDVTECSG